MIKLVFALAVVVTLGSEAANAIQAEPAPPATATPPAPAAVPAAPVPPAAAAAPAAPVDLANDPRMIAAIRRANARADAKCGAGAGLGVVDLQTKMAARTCRRRMVDAARLETESDITGH